MVQSVPNEPGGDAARGWAPAGAESGSAAPGQRTQLPGQRGASSGAAVLAAHKRDDLPGEKGASLQVKRGLEAWWRSLLQQLVGEERAGAAPVLYSWRRGTAWISFSATVGSFPGCC